RQTGLRHVTHAPGDAFPLQPSFIWVGRGCYRFAARTVGWTRYEGEKNGEENSRRAVAGVGCRLCPCGFVGSLHWLPPSSPRLRSPLSSLLPVIPAATPTAEPSKRFPQATPSPPPCFASSPISWTSRASSMTPGLRRCCRKS